MHDSTYESFELQLMTIPVSTLGRPVGGPPASKPGGLIIFINNRKTYLIVQRNTMACLSEGIKVMFKYLKELQLKFVRL